MYNTGSYSLVKEKLVYGEEQNVFLKTDEICVVPVWELDVGDKDFWKDGPNEGSVERVHIIEFNSMIAGYVMKVALDSKATYDGVITNNGKGFHDVAHGTIPYYSKHQRQDFEHRLISLEGMKTSLEKVGDATKHCGKFEKSTVDWVKKSLTPASRSNSYFLGVGRKKQNKKNKMFISLEAYILLYVGRLPHVSFVPTVSALT